MKMTVSNKFLITDLNNLVRHTKKTLWSIFLDEHDQPSEELLSILNSNDGNAGYRKPLAAAICTKCNSLFEDTITKEIVDKASDDIKVPQNCKIWGVPKVNPEIWSLLPTQGKTSDAKSQHAQLATSKATIALMMIANER